MADDTLIISSAFDPAGLERGLNEAAAKLEQFGKNASQSLSFKNIGADVDLATADFKAGIITLEDYQTALQHAKAEFGQLRARGLEPSRAALLQVDTALGRSTGRAGEFGTGVARLRSGMAQLAVSSLHTSNALGQVAQSVLLFAGGSTAVIGVAAGVLALAKAWETYTKEQREAAEATKKNSEALKELREQQKGPVALAQTSVDLQRKEVERLTKAVADLRAEQEKAARGQVGSGVEASLAASIRLRGEEAKAIKEVEEATSRLNAAQRALAEVTTAPMLALAREVAVLQSSEDAVRRLELVELEAAGTVAKGTVAFHDRKVALEQYRDAAKAAKESQQELTARFNQFWDDIAAKANIAGPPLVAGEKAFGLIAARIREIVAAQKELFATQTQEGIEFGFGAIDIEKIERDLSDAAAASNRTFRNIRAQVEDTRTETERFRDAVHDLTRGFDQLIAGAVSVGAIGDQAANALGSILNLTDAVGELRDELGNITFAGVLGVVGAGLGAAGQIIGGLLGPSENARLLAENNQRLADLRVSLDNSLGTAGALATSAAQLATLQGLAGGPSPRGGGFATSQQDLTAALAEAGLTVEEFAAQIEQLTGLDILDDKGRLLGNTFVQADEALRLMIDAATHFSDTVAVMDERFRVEQKLGLQPGGDLEANRRKLLGGLDLGVTEAWVEALDLSTEAGRAAYKEFLISLEQLAAQGKLTADELGAFPNVDELLGPIGEGADAIAQAEEDAAAALEAIQAEAQAAADALAEMEKQFNSFSSRNAIDALRARILGEDKDPVAVFKRQIANLGDFIPGLADWAATIDLATEKGREELRLFLATQLSQMTPMDLAAEFPDISWDEFIEFLESGADVLDFFNESVTEATKSLLNMPSGINLAALEFQAQAAGGDTRSRGFPDHGPRANTTDAIGPTTVMGDITIVVQGSGDPEKVADKVVRRLKQISNARFGTPDKWSET